MSFAFLLQSAAVAAVLFMSSLLGPFCAPHSDEERKEEPAAGRILAKGAAMKKSFTGKKRASRGERMTVFIFTLVCRVADPLILFSFFRIAEKGVLFTV